MDDMLGGASHSPRLPKATLAAGVAIAATAAAVAYTGTGLDVLALALLVFLVVVIERTVGDWFAELMGPAISSTLLAGAAGLCVWQLLAGGGRETTYRFFAAAEHRGYRTLYLNPALDYGTRVYGIRSTSANDPNRAPAPNSRAVSTPRPSSTSSANVPTTGAIARSRVALAPQVAGQERPQTPSQGTIASGVSNMLRLSVPSEARAGEMVAVAVALTGIETPLPNARVEFLVDGRVVETANVRPDGTAVAQLTAPPSGRHTVRARLAGFAGTRGASSATTLVVLPSR